MDAEELIKELVGLQRHLGDTDRQFAKRLGITHAYWVMLRNGKRTPGRKLFLGAMRFPRFEAAAWELLSQT